MRRRGTPGEAIRTQSPYSEASRDLLSSLLVREDATLTEDSARPNAYMDAVNVFLVSIRTYLSLEMRVRAKTEGGEGKPAEVRVDAPANLGIEVTSLTN